MMKSEFTRVNLAPAFFGDRPVTILQHESLRATAFKYSTGVCGLRVENEHCSMVVLPYMGQQIWFANFCGRNLTQRSVFEEPLATTKFGDNYGGLLIHCGLTNINCPGEGEDYPIHGELPFAVYPEAYAGIGRDEDGVYIAAGGTFVYRNSQEYYYAYSPELKLYQGETKAQMHIDIHNRRSAPLDYMFMCHINWLAVEGSRIVYSAPKDREHIVVTPTELGGDSPRAAAVREYGRRLATDPLIGDVLDSDTQCYDPEMCVSIRYKADETGWAHAMQVMPEGDACYVGFDTGKLPYGLRWICRTGDEDAVGIALPTTGTNHSTAYQREHGLYNTLAPGDQDKLRFNFGYLPKEKALLMERHIDQILGE